MQKEKRKIRMIISSLLIFLILLMIGSLFLGRLSITPYELYGILVSNIRDVTPYWNPRQESIVIYTRVPRIILACLVGASLSAAGASYQGIFQNPMAAPDILGASAGAAFGASLAIVSNAGSRMIMLSAFFFSILTILLVYLVSKAARGNQAVTLILAGVMISSLFSSGTSFIKLIADTQTQLPAITYWLMGSLNGVGYEDIQFSILPILAGLVVLLLIRWRINVLTIGDAEAQTMGVNVKAMRLVVIVCATLITSASVAVSGMIGWIGLVIPHLCRRLTGNDYRYLMPAAMLFGACFLLIVDDISRNLLSTELPLGILNAVIGVPFFIYLLLYREGLR